MRDQSTTVIQPDLLPTAVRIVSNRFKPFIPTFTNTIIQALHYIDY